MTRFVLTVLLGLAVLSAACATGLDRSISGSATATTSATSTAAVPIPTTTGSTATATAVGTVTATALPTQPPAPPTPNPAPSATPPPAPTPVVTPIPPPSSGSGVYGIVTVGPSCPVQRIDQPCPDKPYAGTLRFSDAAGREVARVTAGADGMYSVALPPGNYHVVAEPPPGRPLPRGGDADVTVSAGSWTRLDMSYDSGIR